MKPRLVAAAFLLFLPLTAGGALSAAADAEPAAVTVPLAEGVQALPVAAETRTGHQRTSFRRWIDADHVGGRDGRRGRGRGSGRAHRYCASAGGLRAVPPSVWRRCSAGDLGGREVRAGAVQASGVAPPARGVAGDVDADFNHQLGFHQRDVSTAAPPGGKRPANALAAARACLVAGTDSPRCRTWSRKLEPCTECGRPSGQTTAERAIKTSGALQCWIRPPTGTGATWPVAGTVRTRARPISTSDDRRRRATSGIGVQTDSTVSPFGSGRS